MALTEAQQARVEFLEQVVASARGELRTLYAIRDGVILTDGERTARLEAVEAVKLETLPELAEAVAAVAEAPVEGLKA